MRAEKGEATWSHLPSDGNTRSTVATDLPTVSTATAALPRAACTLAPSAPQCQGPASPPATISTPTPRSPAARGTAATEQQRPPRRSTCQARRGPPPLSSTQRARQTGDCRRAARRRRRGQTCRQQVAEPHLAGTRQPAHTPPRPLLQPRGTKKLHSGPQS